MAQICDALPDDQKPRLKTWGELEDGTQTTLVGMAAGTLDWAEDRTLHETYVDSVLDNDPELRAALLHSAGAPPV